MASSLAPERVRHVRVAIVGDTGCGKSTLTRVLAGDPANTRVERTSGVNPRVRLIDVFDPRANAHRPCFVELWDLDGREDHKPERGALYHDLDGVVLVHDLSLSRRAPEMEEGLRRWAREVAASATFAAPSPDACPWRVSPTENAQGDASPHVLRGGFGGVPVPVLVVGAKAELRRAGGTREASSFAEDDFFGGARAGGFDPSERAAAFVRRVCARVARALRLRPARWWRGVGGHDTREKGTSSSGALPTTMRDVFLRRVFSGDALAQTVGDDAFDSRAARDGGLLCRELESFGARSLGDDSEGYRENTRETLARFDAYFAELFARRARAADAARPDDFGAASSAASTAPFAAHFPQSGNTAFSFPGTAGAHTATLRGGAGGGGAAMGMWMGGDRVDAGA